ncbi:GNAT family N-acetyltransferase, partial [Neobacillus drentensis]
MIKKEENLKIKKVIECEIDNEQTENIQELLTESFQDMYLNNRIYFKQVPHFRFLAFNEEKHLLAQVGLDYRVMN